VFDGEKSGLSKWYRGEEIGRQERITLGARGDLYKFIGYRNKEKKIIFPSKSYKKFRLTSSMLLEP
jgi:hypothetical protein